MKEAGWRKTSGTPSGKANLPDLVSPPFTEQHTMMSQLSDSEWPVSVSSLGFQGLISHWCSQKTYSQVTRSIPSSLRLKMLLLKTSQWRINCHCCTLFPYTVVQLPGQPHEPMTGFLKKWQGQKSYTLILIFLVGDSFKAERIALLANCPNQQWEEFCQLCHNVFP